MLFKGKLYLLIYAIPMMFTSISVNGAVSDSEPIALDPLMRHKLTTITPVSGESVRPYMDILKDGETVRYSDEERFNTNQYAGMTFPVVTESLSVGKVGINEGKKVNPQVLMRPLVIIGDDATSINWLQKFKKTLTQRNAQVFVVNVHSIERFKAIQAMAPRLYLHATNGSELARQLSIQHYPFYADKNGVLR